jgi:hypothetical protein
MFVFVGIFSGSGVAGDGVRSQFGVVAAARLRRLPYKRRTPISLGMTTVAMRFFRG